MTPEQKQSQIEFIAKSEQTLGFKATQMHKALRVHQKTYSKWRTGVTAKVILMACKPVLWSEIKND